MAKLDFNSNTWLDMATAPTDGTPILVWHRHPLRAWRDEDSPDGIGVYDLWVDGLSSYPHEGPVVAVWGGGYDDPPSRDEPYGETMPDWWFRDDYDCETPLWPIGWRKIES